MKNCRVFTTISLALLSGILCAYPIIKIGQNFKGLDISVSEQNIYVELDTTDNAVFTEKEEEHTQQARTKLFRCKSPYYLRLEDAEGKTLWKTSDLVLSPQDTLYFANPDSEDVWVGNPQSCGGDYVRVAVDKNEQWIDEYDYKNCPVSKLLYDANNTKQRIGKKLDGSEFQLPDFLSEYKLRANTDDDSAWIFVRRNYYDEWDEETQVDEKSLGLAIIDFEGNVLFHADTDLSSKDIDDIIVSPLSDGAIITYQDTPEREENLIILNKAGQIQKWYSNLALMQNKKIFFPNVRDYFMMVGGDSDYYVISFRTGDIVAEIIGASLDITQVEDKLICVIGYSPMAAVVDITSGKLIQDLTDYNLCSSSHYEVPDVKISASADEVWIYEKYSQESGKTRHFRSASK